MEKQTMYRTGLLWSALLIGVMLALSAYAWVKLPAGAIIPTHWGIDGQPDQYAGKTVGLLLMPLIAAGAALLFQLIMRIEPRQKNIRLSTRAYTIIYLAALGLLAVVHGLLVAAALGAHPDITLLLPLGLGVLFIIIGNYLGKLRSNFFAGIRTPWTLSSELSWDRTHRFGGKLFILLGAILLLSLFWHDSCLVMLLLIGEVVVLTIMLAVYSYTVWRLDLNRKNSGPVEWQSAAKPGAVTAPRTVAILTVLLLLALPFAILLARGWVKPSVEITGRAVSMVQQLSQGNATAAERDFDGPMHAALSPDRLHDIWSDLTSRYGAFGHITNTHITGCWPYTQVYVTMQFARAAVTMRVVFSHAGKISGLWFVKTVPANR